MIKLKATFKGQDGLLGYKHNKEYILEIKNRVILKVDNETHFSKQCMYESIESFLINWDNIKIIK